MRILLVEDDPDLQAYIKQSLENESYVVDASSDGNEGYFLPRSILLMRRLLI